MATIERPEVMESEMSEGSFSPSAPPRRASQNSALRSRSPPRYDSVMAQDQAVSEMNRAGRVGRRGFTESISHAGASVGRFFGIHDDNLRGWNRAGTLPYNNQQYAPIGQQHPISQQQQQEESMPVFFTPPDSPPQESSPAQQRRGRMGRITDRVAATIRRKRKPTSDEVQKSLPTFWPVMTIIIAIIEVCLLVATIITAGLAPISLTPKETYSPVQGFDNASETGFRQIVPNFFIGTSKASLIHNGAMYTPCMRENVNFQVQAAKDRLEENNLRCCRSPTLNQCGMLPQGICTGIYGGSVLGGASRCRSEMNTTGECTGGVTLHPCCVGLLGLCVVTTKDNCSFHQGVWHPDKVLCSDVGTDCFNSICEFTWVGKTIGEIPSQGMRFFSAMFLYDGVVTLLIIGLFKLYNSWVTERRIGWLRVLCIYVVSGIGGFVLSGIFDPTSVSVGGTGSLFGLLGVSLVELLQGWKWVKKPCGQLIKIISLLAILLLLGTLPYIDNYTQIGGFIFGVLASFIFVPYITIGNWDRLKKLCLISIALPIILTLFLFGFVVFYNLPDPDFCPYCSYINCIPYTSTFCDDFITNLLPFIPSTEN